MPRPVLTLAIAALSVGAAPSAPPQFDLKSLAGEWIMEENGLSTGERWSQPDGNSISGTGMSGTRKSLKVTETIRIAPDQSGSLVFWAKPAGKNTETPFRLVHSDAQQLLFENLRHDYPQRIIYFRDGGWLFAKIMRSDGSREKNFVYRPVNPPRAKPGTPTPSVGDVESAITSSRRCVDEDGFTNCLPPTSTEIRNLICWPMLDLAGYIEPYRTSPAAECSFESATKPIGAKPGTNANARWRADWARLHYIETNDCKAGGCRRDWFMPRD